MPADNDHDPLGRWLGEQVRPLPPPPGTFELITRRARRRKIRKAVVTVASAAAVAAVVGVAVPVGMSLNVSPPPQTGQAAGAEKSAASGAPSSLAAGADKEKTATPAASPAATATSGKAATGPLPANFSPVSVTWDSLTTGWIMGPAGTPGQCANANPDICTSVARTDDGGQTWHGLPAPDTVSPGGSTGVSQLRFLNASDGWAYGPELWATEDGGKNWHKVGTGGQSVTALEASNGRAYALFGQCPSGTSAGCTAYTLMTSAAGGDEWTKVPGLPASLATASGQAGGAQIVLAGATGSVPATGYLAAPDGTLYYGGLDGSAWEKITSKPSLPCQPQPATDTSGTPARLLLAAAGVSPSGDRLGAVCELADGRTATYLSQNQGATWQRQVAVLGDGGGASLGVPGSLTALGDGTLILATKAGADGPGGIYRWDGATSSRWVKATFSNPADAGAGFSYIGMTSSTQGVALGGSGDGTRAIWMTADGGKSWQLRPIRS